jgi:hypothetical protein
MINRTLRGRKSHHRISNNDDDDDNLHCHEDIEEEEEEAENEITLTQDVSLKSKHVFSWENLQKPSSEIKVK